MNIKFLCLLIALCITFPLFAGKMPDGLRIEVMETSDKNTSLVNPAEVSTVIKGWNDGVFEVDIKNQTSIRKFLTVSIIAPFQSMNTISFWDGLDEHEIRKSPAKRENICDTFPMSCIWDNVNGVALGIHPDSLFSWIGSYADAKSLRFAVRLIMKPGSGESVKFIAWNFNPRWGWRSAIDSYYLAFPLNFRASKLIDPRLSYGTEAGMQAYRTYVNYYPSLFRRMRCSHGWCYAPFKISPDFYGRIEFWKPEGLSEQAEQALCNMHFGGNVKTPEEMHKQRFDAFQRQIPTNVTNLFYISNCSESHLAETLYQDSILERSNFNWTHHELSWRMFPVGGRYGEQLFKDLVDLGRELPMGGFAWDSSGGMGSRKYRGNLISEMPAAAFDELGPYVIEGVGHSLAIRYMHEHVPVQNGRYRAACKINPGGEHPMPYMLTVASDRGMIEWPFLKVFDPVNSRLLAKSRLLMGQKYIDQHAGLDSEYSTTLNWKKYPPEQLRLLYRARYEYDVLAYLLYGIMPFPYLFAGVPEIYDMLDMFDEIFKMGWYASPGAKSLDGIELARYGQGLHSAIAFCNTATSVKTGNAEIFGADFAGGTPLPFSYTGEVLECQAVEKGIQFNLSLKPRRWLVVENFGAYYGSDIFKVSTKEVRGKYQHLFELRFISEAPIAGKWLFPGLDGYNAPIISINGIPVELKDSAGTFTFGNLIPAGATLTICYNSNLYLSPDTDIMSFKVISDNKPAASIILPSAAGVDAKMAAYWIQDFFDFYYKYGVTPPCEIKLPILTSMDQTVTKNNFILKIDKTEKIQIEGNNLLISAPNESRLAQLTWELLKIFEKKYPFYDDFHMSGKYWSKYKKCPAETEQMLKYCELWNNKLRLYQGPDLEEIVGNKKKAVSADFFEYSFDTTDNVKAINGFGVKNAEISIEEREKAEGTCSVRLKFQSNVKENGVAKISLHLDTPIDLSSTIIEYMMMPMNENCGIQGIELCDANGTIIEEHRYFPPPITGQWNKRTFIQGIPKEKRSGYWFRCNESGNIQKIQNINFRFQTLKPGIDVDILLDDLRIRKITP